MCSSDLFDGDSKSMEIVEHLYIWTKKVQSNSFLEMNFLYEGDIYMRKGITDYFIKEVLKNEENEDDYSYMNYQKLKQMLRKYHVIDKDCDLKGYRMAGKRGAALLLEKDRILKSLMTYKNDFDEDVLADIQAYREAQGMSIKLPEPTFESEGID